MKKKDNTAVESIVVAIIIMFATIGLLVSLAWSYDALDKAIISESELREELRLAEWTNYSKLEEYIRGERDWGITIPHDDIITLPDDITDGDILYYDLGTPELEIDDPKSVYNENNI